jgi:hypothetical protein
MSGYFGYGAPPPSRDTTYRKRGISGISGISVKAERFGHLQRVQRLHELGHSLGF